MENEQLIPLKQFCTFYNIDSSFIHSLTEFGLVELTFVQDTPYVITEQISDIEMLIRLHFDLEINLEGMDAVRNLLEKINALHQETIQLKNRLRMFEGN